MLKTLPFDKLVTKKNCRSEIDETINELVQSIEQNGLLQPLVVREDGNGKFEIIAGHRRYEALRRIGEQFVECNILEDVADKDVIFVQLAENVQRNQMSAYELVQNFEEMKSKYGFNNKKIAQLLHKSDKWVSYQYHAVNTLNTMYGDKAVPEEAKKLSAGQIELKKKRVMQGDSVKVYCNGFTCTSHGHTYQLYFSDFEAEVAFQEFVSKYKPEVK